MLYDYLVQKFIFCFTNTFIQLLFSKLKVFGRLKTIQNNRKQKNQIKYYFVTEYSQLKCRQKCVKMSLPVRWSSNCLGCTLPQDRCTADRTEETSTTHKEVRVAPTEGPKRLVTGTKNMKKFRCQILVWQEVKLSQLDINIAS